MKLALDNIIFSLQNSGGISSYWYELVVRVIKENNIDLTFIEDQKNQKNIFRKKLDLNTNNIVKYNTNLISRILPLKLIDTTNQIFHSSYYRVVKSKKCKNITTVHDFIPERLYNAKFSFNSLMKKKAINNTDVFITVSENTKSDLLYYYPKINPNNINVIYNGVSEDYFQMESNSNYDDNFSVLFVGSRANYKNFEFAVNLISKFDKIKLNIVGKELNREEIIFLKSKLPKQRWDLILNPTNEELNVLYNTSLLLLYPSSYEGFGIPVIEAMKAGCPVLALKSSSIPEIAGTAAVLIDKLSINDFYDGLCNIILNRTYFVKAGLENSTRFSWDKTYLETIQVYNKV